jgi:hypothetical protein
VFLSDWRVLLRRWYVTVSGVAVTVILCLLALNLVPAKQEVTANVLLLPPNPTSPSPQGTPPNPYLSLGGLEGIADVVARAMTDRAMAEALEDRGFRGEYVVEPDPASPAPVILVIVDDDSSGTALDTLDYLLGRLPETLASVQESSDVPTSALISSTIITRDTAAEVIRTSQIRALVVALTGGLAGTFLAAALLDGYMRSLRRRGSPPIMMTPEPSPPRGRVRY